MSQSHAQQSARVALRTRYLMAVRHQEIWEGRSRAYVGVLSERECANARRQAERYAREVAYLARELARIEGQQEQAG